MAKKRRLARKQHGVENSAEANNVPPYLMHKSGQGAAWIDGKYRYFGFGDDPRAKKTYQATIRIWEQNNRVLPEDWFEQAATVANEGFSVDDLVAGYADHLTSIHGEEDSRGDAIYRFRRSAKHVLHVMQGRQISSLQASDIAQLELRLRGSEGTGGKRKTVGTVKRYLGDARAMFRFGVAHFGVDGSVPELLKQTIDSIRPGTDLRPTGSMKKKKADEGLVVDIVKHNAMTPTIKTMILVQALTAMRPAEVCRLCRGHIIPIDQYMRSTGMQTDFHAFSELVGCEITSNETESKTGFVFVPETHKMDRFGKDRVIYLNDRAMEILQPYIDKAKRVGAPFFRPIDNWNDYQKWAKSEREARKATFNASNKHNGNPHGGGQKPRAKEFTVSSYGKAMKKICRRIYPYPPEVSRQQGESESDWGARIKSSKTLTDIRVRHENDWWIMPIQLRKMNLQLIRSTAGLKASAATGGHDEKVNKRHYTNETMDTMVAAGNVFATKKLQQVDDDSVDDPVAT